MVQSSVNPVKYSFQGQNIHENACKCLIQNLSVSDTSLAPRVRPGGDLRCRPSAADGVGSNPVFEFVFLEIRLF